MMRSVFFLSLMNGTAWGGSEEFWFKTAIWMSRNNYRVGVGFFDWDAKKARVDQLKEAGCEVYLLPNKKGLLKNRAVKQALQKIPFKQFALVMVNQGGWEDVLHAPFKYLYKELPAFVINNHNYNENAVLSLKKQRLLQAWINAAEMNFGDTQKIFDTIERKFNIRFSKKQTLVNPIASQPENEPWPYPDVSNTSVQWAMFAEMDVARKSQDTLIRSLSTDKWKNRDWQLHLFGKGKDMAMLVKLVSETGLEDKILFTGYTNNMKETLKQYHFLLQCTRIDAMPITVVEAMAMARPCVVSRVGDMPAWVEDGVNGFVCNEVTEQGIDEALERCWQQKSNWAEMGRRSFETFLKKYPQPYEEKIADILNEYIR